MDHIFQFLLKQGTGEPSVPAVHENEEVTRGQKIACQKEGSLGTNVFSGINGKVLKVLPDRIVIETADAGYLSGCYEGGDARNFVSFPKKEYIPLEEQDPLEMIREAGLVGLGGAGFPTYAKLGKPFESGGTVIINAAECEPILGHNIDAIERRPEDLIRGLEISMEVTNAVQGVIAIKKKHTKALSALEKALSGYSGRIRIQRLRDMYPMGEERAVVRETMGTLLPVTALPLEAGAIVINAETAMRIHEAVDLKKPFMDKDVTVAGKLKGNEKLIRIFHDVPIGMPVGDVFELAGGIADEHGKNSYGELIMGGPFTGKRTSRDQPIVKTTGGLIAAECFPKGPSKIGLLVCACGANEERMRQLAESYGSEVVDVEFCKQALEVKETRKCENPGHCPGQVQKVLAMKKAGAEAVLIGNCTDCSNTVMSCAPQLLLPVYHSTDCALRAVNQPLVRRIHGHIEDL